MPDANPPTARARVSLRDIAAEAGVSHVAVSLALRGDPRISTVRRAEIAAVAERLGYKPDPMLSSLAAYRQSKKPVEIRSTVAWLNQWSNPRDLRRFQEFDAYWQGAHSYAASLGYHLEEFEVGKDLSGPRLQQIMLARNVRGILIPPHQRGFNLGEFDWSPFALVRLGSSVNFPHVHIVTSDQFKCAAMAFARAWGRGYRRIAYVATHRFDLNTGGNFRAGYLSEQDIHVPIRKHLAPLALGGENFAADVRHLKRWLRTYKPDAIVSAQGELPRQLEACGYRVPDDLGVAALSLLDGHFDAGVDQNSLEVGRVAMAQLASLIHQNERGIPRYCRRILVEGRWVDGLSLPERTEPAPSLAAGGGRGATRRK
jgi:LacI family transcriptional regulator